MRPTRRYAPRSNGVSGGNDKRMAAVCGAMLLLLIGGMMLLGNPGALFMGTGQALLEIDPEGCLGPGGWAGAIITTLVTPFGLPIVYLVARLVLPESRPGRIVVTLAIYVVLATAFASWLYINAQNSNAASKAGSIGPKCTPWRCPC